MADPVHVRAEILNEMLLHARREAAQECCGLLAGRDGAITAIYPAANALASATVYEIAPRIVSTVSHDPRGGPGTSGAVSFAPGERKCAFAERYRAGRVSGARLLHRFASAGCAETGPGVLDSRRISDGSGNYRGFLGCARFSGCGKTQDIVILSEAKNLSLFLFWT